MFLIISIVSFKNSRLETYNDIQDRNLYGKIKSVETNIYAFSVKNDSIIVGDRINSMSDIKNEIVKFNSLGFIESEKEYYFNGKLKQEKTFTYNNNNNRLNQIDFIDYYGKGQHSFQKFYYNEIDSLIQTIDCQDTLCFVTEIERNNKNQILEKTNMLNKKTINYTTYEYDNNGKLIKEVMHQNDTIIKIVERVFDKEKIIREKIIENDPYETLAYIRKFEYDNKEKLISIKLFYSDDENSYSLTSFFYDNDLNLIALKQTEIGAKQFISFENQYDIYGNIVEHKRIPSYNDNIKIWSNKLSYDSRNNWIKNIGYYNGQPLYIAFREITYYLTKKRCTTRGVPNVGDFLINRRLLPLGAFLSGDKNADPELPHWSHPQPLGAILKIRKK
jgi:hypothetical protein